MGGPKLPSYGERYDVCEPLSGTEHQARGLSRMQDERVEVTSLLKGRCDEQREKKQAQFIELLGQRSLLLVTWPTPRALSPSVCLALWPRACNLIQHLRLRCRWLVAHTLGNPEFRLGARRRNRRGRQSRGPAAWAPVLQTRSSASCVLNSRRRFYYLSLSTDGEPRLKTGEVLCPRS